MALLGGFGRPPHRESRALEVPLALADGFLGGPRCRRSRPQQFVPAGRHDAAGIEPRTGVSYDGAEEERERRQHPSDLPCMQQF